MCACVCVGNAEVGGGTAPGQRFIRRPASDMQVVRGDDVALECAAEGGKPVPGLTWKRQDGSQLLPSRHNVLLGVYRCCTSFC